MRISVIISTKNRSQLIGNCLQSILNNNYSPYEIIVIDQSTNHETFARIQELIKRSNADITYVKENRSNISIGRNTGIRYAKGDICAFTDDDCIVTSHWLKAISDGFAQFPHVSAAYGTSLAYKPYLHRNQTCPCTFTRNKQTIIDKPMFHSKYIGFGNNMAYRTEVIKFVGPFKTWLGSGSIGNSADDAEFALRTLIKGNTILHNPDMVIYHNKWLTGKEMNKQLISYTCGEMACYGYFYFQHFSFAASVIKENFRESFRGWKHLLNPNDSRKKTRTPLLFQEGGLLWIRLYGLFIGWVYAIVDPIRVQSR